MTAEPLLEHHLLTVDEYERMGELGILDRDSGVELLEGEVPIYARQGVVEVWIADIPGDRVIVHTQPSGGEYGLIRTAYRGEELRPTLLPSVGITVDEILGEPT